MIKVKNKGLYWALIITFAALYLAVAFVSTLHAVTFFQLANTLSLAILLGAAYEIGQASVLFSILMTENKNRVLAWGMMFLLTSLQVTANVYASFKYMDISGTNDWTYWQRAILFAVQAESAEMYKIIISWISGALLPLVALGMTALVAENIRLARGEKEEENEEERIEEIIENEVQKRLSERENQKLDKNKKVEDEIDQEMVPLLDAQENLPQQVSQDIELEKLQEGFKKYSQADQESKEKNIHFPIESGVLKPPIVVDLQPEEKDKNKEDDPVPINKIRGWHLMGEYIDDDHNVFEKGKFVRRDPSKTPTSKKA